MMEDAGNPAIEAWVQARLDGTLYFSVIGVGEIRKGIELMAFSRRRAFLEHWLTKVLLPSLNGRILPVTLPICERWGLLDARRRKQGNPLGMADGLIAATALEFGLSLATRNNKHFQGLGLSVVNPWLDG